MMCNYKFQWDVFRVDALRKTIGLLVITRIRFYLLPEVASGAYFHESGKALFFSYEVLFKRCTLWIWKVNKRSLNYCLETHVGSNCGLHFAASISMGTNMRAGLSIIQKEKNSTRTALSVSTKEKERACATTYFLKFTRKTCMRYCNYNNVKKNVQCCQY